ncbi:MAG: hypothetical protein M4579_006062 [Chaenotheca gracillima]|nr:MAG: hypothetical protein M4579_006062 [Chaenotheca gracillima]
MAYNSGYNPDALPAHAEPDQAAAMLAGQASGRPHAGSQSHNQGGSRPHAPSQSYSNPAVPGAYNKPQPPLPSRQSYPKHQLGAYAAGPGQQGGGYAQSPPPSNYGMTLPPQQHHNRPPPNSRPPATPVPPAGADPTLFPLFKTVDKGNTGQLTEKELGAALVNGDWSTFDPDTVRMMIKMFDTDRSGTIGFDEFWQVPSDMNLRPTDH